MLSAKVICPAVSFFRLSVYESASAADYGVTAKDVGFVFFRANLCLRFEIDVNNNYPPVRERLRFSPFGDILITIANGFVYAVCRVNFRQEVCLWI